MVAKLMQLVFQEIFWNYSQLKCYIGKINENNEKTYGTMNFDKINSVVILFKEEKS